MVSHNNPVGITTSTIEFNKGILRWQFRPKATNPQFTTIPLRGSDIEIRINIYEGRLPTDLFQNFTNETLKNTVSLGELNFFTVIVPYSPDSRIGNFVTHEFDFNAILRANGIPKDFLGSWLNNGRPELRPQWTFIVEGYQGDTKVQGPIVKILRDSGFYVDPLRASHRTITVRGLKGDNIPYLLKVDQNPLTNPKYGADGYGIYSILPDLSLLVSPTGDRLENGQHTIIGTINTGQVEQYLARDYTGEAFYDPERISITESSILGEIIIPSTKPFIKCNNGFHLEGGNCVPDSLPPIICDPGFHEENGICVPDVVSTKDCFCNGVITTIPANHICPDCDDVDTPPDPGSGPIDIPGINLTTEQKIAIGGGVAIASVIGIVAYALRKNK